MKQIRIVFMCLSVCLGNLLKGGYTSPLKMDEASFFHDASSLATFPSSSCEAPLVSDAEKKRLATDFCHLLARFTEKKPEELFNVFFKNGLDELTLIDPSLTLTSFFTQWLPNCLGHSPESIEKSALGAHFSEIWEGLIKLTWLKQLHIIGIPLTCIPDSVARLQNLRVFILSNNNLTSPLPETMSMLPYLEHLVVSENQLTVLPHTLCQVKTLKYISFRSNKLTAIPEETAYALTTLPHLNTLNLADNKLTDVPYTLRLHMHDKIIL